MNSSRTGGEAKVSLRCPFCLTVNRVILSRAADRPKCGKCDRPMLLDRPVKIEEEDFDRVVLASEAPVLVDFYADWCGPCKILAPMVDDIARQNIGRVLVAKVDTDRAPRIAERYGIRSIPTIILFQGGEESGRSLGIMPEELRGLVERATA